MVYKITAKVLQFNNIHLSFDLDLTRIHDDDIFVC